ncbi:polysaccharide deacetylase family protein [Cecembia lonarensis]|uniref:Polysaccharide deacetylase family sporulation protein PdaB n=1 Tax=Cecembia lonarensis (strain CCUG 58316 / KCTC 22772 / LW9) TaxID=1225176 RepID=K1KT91_CECL9|nr:polysaccharide deacetylase family protein [Cecembia lonarensis]EKB47390.1 polysaccharide deacetylase family sporulation protein PdaB [Cecembia lonarensis LW9]
MIDLRIDRPFFVDSFFIISLDFELHWGRFDKTDLHSNLSYYHQTRNSIPQVLELFQQYGIHATWATVGSLMAANVEEWKAYWPELKPAYHKQRFSAYAWFEEQKQIREEALFAPDLVKLILDYPHQELGSHTFSHYYTCEAGQCHASFQADLKAAQQIAKDKFGLELKSLVFPRNQMDKHSIRTAAAMGFQTVRTNPSDWYWKNTQEENLLKKLFRTGDTLVALGKKTSYPLPKRQGIEVLGLPASRLLRPFRSNSFFNQRRITRIKEEMEEAAKSGLAYHLWWHPHNFGNLPDENLKCLEEILVHFSKMRDNYGMQSIHMGESCKGLNC